MGYSHLKDFTTSKKDADQLSRKPPKTKLLKSENIFKEQSSVSANPSNDDN